jgi:hypothetical protein
VWAGVFLLTGAVAGQATDLNLRIKSREQETVTVHPGATVPYVVVGELSDAQNQGLALFSFDLEFSGGPLAPALSPVGAPMSLFAVPAGISNPQGFGGAATNGRLVQVGGAQNTINNTFAPYPLGDVLTGVGLPGQPVVLVAGRLQAPETPGVFTLAPTAIVANVIATGATGDPVWRVEAAGSGAVVPLTVVVQAPRPSLEGRVGAKP